MEKVSGRSIPPPPLLMVLLALGVIVSIARKAAAREGVPPPPDCTHSCGGKPVPYPFGFETDGEDCYLKSSLSLKCNDSYSPPKLTWGDFEVLDVILPSGHMRVLMEISYDCYNRTSDNAGYSTWNVTFGSTFMLSYEENVFVAIGCDTQAKLSIGPNKYGGCMTGCNSLVGIDGQCLGIGCCQSHIPQGVDRYETSFDNRENRTQTYRFNNCSYSFVVERNNYTFRRSDLTYMNQSTVFPMILDWFIGDQTCVEAKKNTTSYACLSANSDCLNSKNGPGYICNCSQGYQGNPYITNGCHDIDECKLDRSQYPCYGICVNTKGSYNCTCPVGFTSRDPKRENCTEIIMMDTAKRKIPRGLVIGIGILISVLLVLVLLLLFCFGYQRRKNIRLKKRFFEKNGGIHLQEVLSVNNINSFKIFKEDELETATKNFDKDLMIGQGGSGKVYKGIIEDKIMLAVKRFMTSDEKDGREFANEILILSKINHTNIVKLLGCCLESKIPMLVYEYIPGGTLDSYLHNKSHPRAIPFSTRLQLAVQTARALKYLHIDASPPICHGDVKSSNILLDGHLAKVSDFGASILAPKDNLQFKTLVQGTCGYLDPEYLLTGYLTDRSDVYSFGVVLAELLTRRVPISWEESGTAKNLSNMFVSRSEENRLGEILDPDILHEGLTNEIQKVAAITVRCLNIQGKNRPTMKEVTVELEELGAQETHPWEQYYQPEADSLLGESSTFHICDASLETRAIFAIEGAR